MSGAGDDKEFTSDKFKAEREGGGWEVSQYGVRRKGFVGERESAAEGQDEALDKVQVAD